MTIYVHKTTGERYALVGIGVYHSAVAGGASVAVYTPENNPQAIHVCQHHQFAEWFTEANTYTTGHCSNHNRPGGCHLHNLQCGYPHCDRKYTNDPQNKG